MYSTSQASRRPVMTDEEEISTVRSQLHIPSICCASETSRLSQILRPHVISVNTTTRMLYIDHPVSTPLGELVDQLQAGGFTSQILRDGTSREHRATSILEFQSSSEAQAALNLLQEDGTVADFSIVTDSHNAATVTYNPFTTTIGIIQAQVARHTPCTILKDGTRELWQLPTPEAIGKETTAPRPTVVFSGIFWLVSLLHWIVWDYLKYFALVSVAFGLPPIATKAILTMRHFQFDANCLMLFASVGAIALQDYTEAATVVFLFAASEFLEHRATSRARSALREIVDLRPEYAEFVHPATRACVRIPAALVPVGSTVVVKTGEKIPCDGVVVDGSSTVDESHLTGEARPIRKAAKSVVSGGTVNSGLSPLSVRTTATCDDSAVSRLIRLVETAQTNRSPTEKLVDRFAMYYTPIIVLTALLMCTVPWAFGRGREWTHNGLILIVVACPCALIISTPVCYVAGLTAAAQKGVLIKGGAFLEALGGTKHICMDKTGTLTNGDFALLELKVLDDTVCRSFALQHLALMEQKASHPVAQAILNAAKSEGVSIGKSLFLEKHEIVKGEGVTGVISGKEVNVGNERMFERLDLLGNLAKKDRAMLQQWKSIGGTVGLMSIEGLGIVCAFCTADAVRKESALVVGRLKRKLGVNITMLTGDSEDAALVVGRQVGLSPQEIRAKLLPEEKLVFINSLQLDDVSPSEASCLVCNRRRFVVMCGDGADVGIAMGQGAALSMETSDLTLLDSNLEKLEFSINLGKRVTNKILANVFFSIAVKFVVLGFALAGRSDLWAAIASDVGTMLLVTLNAMTLLPRTLTNQAVNGVDSIGAWKSDTEDARSTTNDSHSMTDTLPCQKGCCEPEPDVRTGLDLQPNLSCITESCCDNTAMDLPCSSDCRPQPGCCDANRGATDCCGNLASAGYCGQSIEPKINDCNACCGASDNHSIQSPTTKDDCCCDYVDSSDDNDCCTEADRPQAQCRHRGGEAEMVDCVSQDEPQSGQDSCCGGCCEEEVQPSKSMSSDEQCRGGCCDDELSSSSYCSKESKDESERVCR